MSSWVQRTQPLRKKTEVEKSENVRNTVLSSSTNIEKIMDHSACHILTPVCEACTA